MVLSDTSLMNCFGSALRDTGHRREPDPPQRITGWLLVAFLFELAMSDLLLRGTFLRAVAASTVPRWEAQSEVLVIAAFVA